MVLAITEVNVPKLPPNGHGLDSTEYEGQYGENVALLQARNVLGWKSMQLLDERGLMVVHKRTWEMLTAGLLAPLEELVLGPFRIVPHAFSISRDGDPIALTPTEWRILLAILAGNGMVVGHERILVGVWGKEFRNDHHLLRVNIARLRAKTEPEFRGLGARYASDQPYRLVRTVPGLGYYCPLLRERNAVAVELASHLSGVPS
jgi:DNA-binding winged helix-turn-helix (wHTH) protein